MSLTSPMRVGGLSPSIAPVPFPSSSGRLPASAAGGDSGSPSSDGWSGGGDVGVSDGDGARVEVNTIDFFFPNSGHADIAHTLLTSAPTPETDALIINQRSEGDHQGGITKEQLQRAAKRSSIGATHAAEAAARTESPITYRSPLARQLSTLSAARRASLEFPLGDASTASRSTAEEADRRDMQINDAERKAHAHTHTHTHAPIPPRNRSRTSQIHDDGAVVGGRSRRTIAAATHNADGQPNAAHATLPTNPAVDSASTLSTLASTAAASHTVTAVPVAHLNRPDATSPGLRAAVPAPLSVYDPSPSSSAVPAPSLGGVVALLSTPRPLLSLPLYSRDLNLSSKAAVTPTSYSSRAQAFFHELINASSEELAARQRHKHAMIIHQPLNTITANTKLHHSIRFNGVDMGAFANTGANDTPPASASTSSPSTALPHSASNAAPIDSLTSLLSAASLAELDIGARTGVGSSRGGAASRSSSVGVLKLVPTLLPALGGMTKHARNESTAAASATVGARPAPTKHVPLHTHIHLPEYGESALLVALRKQHAAPNLSSPPRDARALTCKEPIVSSVGLTLDDSAIAAARKLLAATLAAPATSRQHTSTAANSSRPTRTKRMHAPNTDRTHKHHSKSSTAVSSLRPLAPAPVPSPGAPIRPILSARVTPLIDSLAIGRTQTQTSLNEEKRHEHEPPYTHNNRKTETSKPNNNSARAKTQSLSKSNRSISFDSTPATISPSNKVTDDESTPPPFIVVSPPARVPDSPVSIPASVSVSGSVDVSVCVPPPHSPRPLSAATYFHSVFYPAPGTETDDTIGDLLKRSPTVLDHARTLTPLIDLPQAETAGSISFRRHPSEQADYLRRLESAVHRQADSTLSIVSTDSSGLTSAGLRVSALNRNAVESDARDAFSRITKAEQSIADADRIARELADLKWREDKRIVEAEDAMRTSALTARLAELASRMHAKSAAMWSSLSDAREQAEKDEFETLARTSRHAELSLLDAKLTLKHAADQSRWDAEWAESRRAKELARIQAERDELIKAVEIEAYRATEWEKKRIQARSGVLWVRVHRAENLGEENFAATYGPLPPPPGTPNKTSATNSPIMRPHQLPAATPTNGVTRLSLDSSSDRVDRTPSIFPKGTTSCLSVQIRFKAASLSSEIVHTRYFGRDTNPTIGECFKLDVSNAYLQTVCLVVQTSPPKQVEAWEREIRAALAMHAAAGGGAVSGGAQQVSDLIRTGAVQVKQAVHKDPAHLTGPPTPTRTKQHQRHNSGTQIATDVGAAQTSLDPPSATPTAGASSSTSLVTSRAASPAMSQTTASPSPTDSQSVSRAPSPTNSAATGAARRVGSSLSVPTPMVPHAHGRHRSQTGFLTPLANVASSGLGAGSTFFPIDILQHLSRLRSRSEVVSRIDELGRVEVPIASIRSCPHGRMAKTLGFTRALSEAQRKEREIRRHAAKRAAIASSAINTATAASVMAMVATNTLRPQQLHSQQLHLRSPSSGSSSPVMTGMVDSPPVSGTMKPRTLGLPGTSPSPPTNVMKTISTLDGEKIEIVQCGNVWVELLLVPLFSRGSHERTRPAVANLRIGSSVLSESEQLAIEADMAKESEYACAQDVMPDMDWLDDPTFRPPQTEAQIRLAQATTPTTTTIEHTNK